MSRLLRSLVCLLLICCILVYSFAVPVHATAVLPTVAAPLVGISPAAAVAAILICLGIGVLSTVDFESLVDSIVDALPSDFFVTVDSQTMIEAISYNSDLFVAESLITWVQDYLFDGTSSSAPVLSSVYTLPSEFSSILDIVFASGVPSTIEDSLKYFPYCYCITFKEGLAVVFSGSAIGLQYGNPYLRFNSQYFMVTSSSDGVFGYKNGWNGYFPFSPLASVAQVMPNLGVVTACTSIVSDSYVADDVLVNVFAEAAPDLDDDEEYQAWKRRQLLRVSDPGEDPEDDGLKVLLPYYPIPAADNVESLPASPSDAWITAPNLSLDSGIVSDPYGEVELDAESLPDPGIDPAPSDPSTPGGTNMGGNMNNFVLPDLRDFFPFCIPFDLRDMLAALCADPVAPSFTFATAFLGNVYEVNIDLSPWNNVASVLRTVQLCICIVGLAFATRKFIKW